MPCKDDVFSSTVKTWLLQVEIRFCNERAKPLEPVDITLLRYLLDTLDHACSFAKCAAGFAWGSTLSNTATITHQKAYPFRSGHTRCGDKAAVVGIKCCPRITVEDKVREA
jgi:hypothetical protein